MKKVCIVTRRMVAGGIEKALINMLKAMPKEEYEIDLFVMGLGGEFIEDIPSWVNIEPIFGYENSSVEKIMKYLKSFKFKNIINLSLSRLVNGTFKQELYLSKTIENNKIYDIAIAYHTPASFPVMYVSNKINAKKKLAWIHSDVSFYKNEMERYIKFYDNYEKIICVSKDSKINFDNQYKHLANKTEVFFNIIDKKEILEKSKVEKVFSDELNYLKLVTVARLTEQKGFDLLIETAVLLKNENINFRWYIVGEGELRANIEEEIKINTLVENIKLVGLKNNPYPYMAQCDIYVQPSKHEGFCITLAEAKYLNKVIIATNFVGAREQLINGENGIIINYDKQELFEAIKNLLNNKDIKNKFIYNLEREKYIKHMDIKTIF